jgi:hypothetical protein
MLGEPPLHLPSCRLREGAEPNPFVDPQGYRAYVAHSEAAYREQLDRERTPAVDKRR